MLPLNKISAPGFPSLAYRKEGEGNVLVLLHGFPDDGGLWRFVFPILSKHFTVITPDLPCSGGSSFDGAQLTIDLMADAVKAILDHEGVTEAVILGHSMGGYVALAIAQKFSNLVRGLSLVHSTPVADTKEKIVVRRKAIDIINKGGKDTFIRQMIPNLFSDHTKQTQQELVIEQMKKGVSLSAECLKSFYNAMIIRPGRVETLKDATFPVMWVLGKDDTVTPMSTVMQHCIHANVNFVYSYSHCGHMSMLEHPETLANDMVDFGVYCYEK